MIKMRKLPETKKRSKLSRELRLYATLSEEDCIY